VERGGPERARSRPTSRIPVGEAKVEPDAGRKRGGQGECAANDDARATEGLDDAGEPRGKTREICGRQIGPDATIRQDTTIGDDTTIGAGATIDQEVVIRANVSIG
jgi:NDP-sugar pyrophosphorylase family protein